MLGKGLSSTGLVIWAIGQKNNLIHCYGISDDGVIEACLGSGFLFFVLILHLLLVVTSLHIAVSHSSNGEQEGGFILFTLYFLSKQGKCNNKKMHYLYIRGQKHKNGRKKREEKIHLKL